MAGFDIEFPDDFLGGVLETDPQELCSEMLSEAAPLFEAFRNHAQRACKVL